MRPYIVRRGDHLIGIASRLGFDPGEAWQATENEDLRAERGDGQVLAPGDILYVPETSEAVLGLDAKKTNRYGCRMPGVRVRLVIRAGAEVLSDEPYRIEGLRRSREGTTDREGVLDEVIPAHVREIRVVVPERGIALALRVGGLDPAGTTTGLEQRLQSLGALPSLAGLDPGAPERPDRDARDAQVREALRRLQRAHGLDETGEADPETLEALGREHS